jgi:hypothetical protein
MTYFGYHITCASACECPPQQAPAARVVVNSSRSHKHHKHQTRHEAGSGVYKESDDDLLSHG